jgi:hypothetical protein
VHGVGYRFVFEARRAVTEQRTGHITDHPSGTSGFAQLNWQAKCF